MYSHLSRKQNGDVRINPHLRLYNPTQVYHALVENDSITKWLMFIANHYMPRPRKILLIYPCSAKKPYQFSRSYRQLYSTLNQLGDEREEIHLVTISEPFGLVPEEFYGVKTKWHDWKNDWYDCPGLFRWWCTKHKLPYSEEHLEACIDILASYVARFLERARSRKTYSKIIGFVRTYTSTLEKRKDHTHRRIIEKAAELARVKVTLIPSRRDIRKIVKNHGRLAWDMYGVAHPAAQARLLQTLRHAL